MSTWVNDRGNKCTSHFVENGERYYYDFEECTPDKGWVQYDTSQDAWYFGVWVNVKDRKVLTYAEGDVTLVECPDDDHLRAELKKMGECYGDPPPAAVGYDNDGTRTEYYDERPSL